MHSSVIKDIKAVLDAAHSAVKRKNYVLLDNLSNRLNHSAAIHQDREISLCAVAVFALSKIFTNEKYLTDPNFPGFRNDVLANLKAARKVIGTDTKRYEGHLRLVENSVKRFDEKLKLYQTPLLTYARAKKASHAIEHGLSVSQASKLFNVPNWELSKHTGKSVSKHYASTKFNKQRIELLKRLFRIK